MINLYELKKVTSEEMDRLLDMHRPVIPRNWEMRIQRIFTQVFDLDDFTKIMKADYFEKQFPLTTAPRERIWDSIIAHIKSLWNNHKAWTREVALDRTEWSKIIQCDVCGFFFTSWRPNDGLADSPWGYVCLCDMCSSSTWQCAECETWFFGHDRCYASGSTLCEPCFDELKNHGDLTQCHVCGSDCFREDITVIVGRSVCTICYDERVVHCIDCGFTMIDGMDRVRWIDDECYCQECYNGQAVVAAYDHYIENPPFLTISGERVRDDSLFFGLEFEIEDNWSNREISEYELGKRCMTCVPADWGYCKHDGSMYRGVEWVTHPMSPLFYKTHRKDLDKILNSWKECGFRTDQWDEERQRYNCGLHIHMSKAAFGSAHLYKFVRFFYKIHLRKLVQQIAERDVNEFAQWCPEDYLNGVKLAKNKRNVSGNRYSVINLIGGHWHENHPAPAKTVEFRLFQGTLNPDQLHKDIEFLLSVYYFTRDYSLTHITEKNYFKFLGQTKNRWRYLTNFLRKQLEKEI